jgi:hypothetical protein
MARIELLTKSKRFGHKGVMKASEVRAIVHLFCEDVGGIHFARDMVNLKSLVLDPFANQILAKLDVLSSL